MAIARHSGAAHCPHAASPACTSPSSWTATAAGPPPTGSPARRATKRGCAPRAPSSRPRCAEGVGTLTLYAFSSDNWKRPGAEVTALMRLFRRALLGEAKRCLENGVRLTILGRRDRLPSSLRHTIEQVEALTASGARMHLRVAVDYSARDAMMRAAMALRSEAAASAGIARHLLRAARARGSRPPAGVRRRPRGPHGRRTAAERLPALGMCLRRVALREEDVAGVHRGGSGAGPRRISAAGTGASGSPRNRWRRNGTGFPRAVAAHGLNILYSGADNLRMPNHTRVLVVDGEGTEATGLRHLLSAAGYEISHAPTAERAVAQLERAGADVVLLALDLVGLPGVAQLASVAGGAQLVLLVAKDDHGCRTRGTAARRLRPRASRRRHRRGVLRGGAGGAGEFAAARSGHAARARERHGGGVAGGPVQRHDARARADWTCRRVAHDGAGDR